MLTDTQAAALLARFPHFDLEASLPLFAEDQDGGTFIVRDQGAYPGVRMANGAIWFYDKDRRPQRLTRSGTQPMKTQAPTGAWRALCDDRTCQELTVVEGEGHAVALLSVGLRGVVACGGVSKFQARTGGATEELTRLFAGKRVRLLFDFDHAGLQAVELVKTRLIEVGATRVAIVPPQDWDQGQDVEDWLAAMPDRETAYAQLGGLLQAARWQDEATERDAQEEDQALPETRVTSARRVGDSVVITVYDHELGQLGLAVLGEPSQEPSPADPSVMHDAEEEREGMARGWMLLDRWLYGGVRYVPDEAGTLLQDAQAGVVLPAAPPAESYGTTEDLWLEVRDFIQRWLVLGSRAEYNALVAYVFLSYRVFDAGFGHVPYLRFRGGPGTGKGRGLKLMQSLCCWTMTGQPTSANLHRIIQHYGEITMLMDEMHLDRGRSNESAEQLVDTLNLGNERGKGAVRCSPVQGGGMAVETFSLFGPKITAGYGGDEHPALARRTIQIDMDAVPRGAVTGDAGMLALPAAFHQRAYELRRKLMAWRGSKFHLGLPDPAGPRAERVAEVVGLTVGQSLWPLIEMVPPGWDEVENDLLEIAAGRKEAVAETLRQSTEAQALEALTQCKGYRRAGGKRFYPTFEVAERLAWSTDPRDAGNLLGRKLRLKMERVRLKELDGKKYGGVLLDGSEIERRTFADHGVEHPFDTPEGEEPPPGL